MTTIVFFLLILSGCDYLPQSEAHLKLQEDYEQLEKQYQNLQKQYEQLQIKQAKDAVPTSQPVSPLPSSMTPRVPIKPSEMWNSYRQAQSLIQQKELGQAVKLLHSLELLPEDQLQVRVRYTLGELFFKEQQFDLALQVYEKILEHHPRSGFVVEALKRLVSCTSQLNLSEKKHRYRSLLQDVFKVNA